MSFLKKLSLSYPLITSIGFITIIWVFLVLFKLGDHFMYAWDESRYALNTYDFLNHKNPFLVTANGKPDWWNTKPPFAIWMQAFSTKIFGYNEFGVRFPSALFSLLTSFSLLFYSKKILKNIWVGTLASIILFTLSHYNGYHITRTADVDSILIFFTTNYIFTFFLITQKQKVENKTIIIFSVLSIFAFYTKSIAGFIPLAAIAVSVLITPSSYFVFKSYKLYIAGIAILFFSFSYYFIREYFDTGYIENAILSSEATMFNRNSGESLFFKTFFYFFTEKIGWYLYFLLFAPILILNKKINTKVLVYTLIIGISFVAIHARSVIKKEWYDVPAIPILVFGIAFILIELVKIISTFSSAKKYILGGVLTLFFLFAANKEVRLVIGNVYYPKSYTTTYIYDAPSEYIKKHIAGNKNITSASYIPRDRHDYFYDNIIFYTHSLKEQGQNIQFKYPEDIKKGDTIITRRSNPVYIELSKPENIIQENDIFAVFVNN